MSGNEHGWHCHLRILVAMLAWAWLAVAPLAREFDFADPYFESVGDSESIPGGVIPALLMDARGWLWIGTQKGLIRYDGYRFRRFVNRPGDGSSLGGDFVRCLWSDSRGRIWIGTVSDGLSVFDPATERFENFHHDPLVASSISPGQIYAMAGDRNGGLWLASNEGLDFLAQGSRRFVHFRHDANDPRSLADNRVHGVIQDRHGRIWVATGDGVQRMLADGRGFERIGSDPHNPASLAGQEVWLLFEAQDGKIWLGTFTHGAAWIDPASLKLNRLALNPASKDALGHGWVDAIFQPQPDQIWLGTAGGGITVVAAGDGRVIRQLRHDLANGSSLASNDMGAFLKDPSGWIWVGTWGSGLQRINMHNQAFMTLRHSQTRPDGLSHPNVLAFLEQGDGSILVGTEGKGIDILDRQRGLIGGFRKENGLPDGTVAAMVKTLDGTLWIGTRQSGVWRLASGSSRWQQAEGLPGPQIYRLLLAGDGTVWAATNNGLARWQGQAFVALPKEDGQPMQATCHALAQDDQGRIWLGSNTGLWLYQPPQPNQPTASGGRLGLRNIRHDKARADSLISDAVHGVLFDSRGRLWVATALGLERLQQWDGQHAVFEHVNATLGRDSGELGHDLLEDAQGRIWTGDHVFDPASKRLYPLSRADGFDIGGRWIGAYGKTRDGLLLYGGNQGMLVINPALFRPWAFQPQVVLTELKINNKTSAPGLLGQQREAAIRLNPGERQFAVEFTALDYSQPSRNRYRYRLQGYEDEWIEADANHRSASYGNLWPGQYQLQVRGSNRLGEFSRHELVIAVQVLPAFWQRPWFMLLTLLLFCTALVLAWRWRVASMRVREQDLQNLIAARTADILKLGEIGQELTATIDTEQAFERVYAQVRARVDAHVFGIGILDRTQDSIRFEYLIEADVRQSVVCYPMSEGNRPAVWCVRNRRELVVGQRQHLLNFVSAIMPVKNGQSSESVIFLPLITEQQVIGCLTVQSQHANAFSNSQLEFLRVLASYSAIAIANAAAHKSLLAAQQQLIQQDKMATLGQLIANVAHEINTPLGAVKASGGNIANALEDSIRDLPRLYQLLDTDDQTRFATLIHGGHATPGLLTSREERRLAKELHPMLEQAGVKNAAHKAAILVQLRSQALWPELLPLLKHAEADFIFNTAKGIANIINNTDNINLAVARVAKIVFALKSYSRRSNSTQMAETDLAQDLETVITIYQHQIRHGTTLVRDYEAIPPLRCAADELNQVWTNLIHNALHAMRFEGTLTLTIRRIGNEAMVAVGDSGCGIEDGIRDRIFDAFFTTKAAGEGSGLGLDISKKIVEKHHGRIEVVTKIGVGSTFSVFLPYPDGSNRPAD